MENLHVNQQVLVLTKFSKNQELMKILHEQGVYRRSMFLCCVCLSSLKAENSVDTGLYIGLIEWNF